MGFTINKEHTSNAVHKLKSLYSDILNKMTKLTELSTLTMHHSMKNNEENNNSNKKNKVS